MRQTIIIAVCLLVVLTRPAAAQENLSTTAKSKKTALRWSLGSTMLPALIGGTLIGVTLGKGGSNELVGVSGGLVLGSLGLIVGPTIGHYYAGSGPNTPGLPFRLAGITSGAIGALIWASSDHFLDKHMDIAGDVQFGMYLIGFGAILFLTAAVVDFASLGETVDEYNERNGLAALSLTPTYNVNDNTVGASLCLRF